MEPENYIGNSYYINFLLMIYLTVFKIEFINYVNHVHKNVITDKVSTLPPNTV